MMGQTSADPGVQVICPGCSSENVAAARMIYESGTQTSNFFAVGASNLANGLIGGESKSQTLLSQRASPPKKKSSVPAVLAFVFLAFAIFSIGGTVVMATNDEGRRSGNIPVASFFFVVFAIACCIFWRLARRNDRYNNTDWPRLYRSWISTWHCRSCGKTFYRK